MEKKLVELLSFQSKIHRSLQSAPPEVFLFLCRAEEKPVRDIRKNTLYLLVRISKQGAELRH